MLRIFLWLVIVAWFLLAMLGRALAVGDVVPPPPPTLSDKAINWLTVVMCTATLLANVLPPHLRITQVLARIAIDLRGILIPDPRKTTKLPPLD